MRLKLWILSLLGLAAAIYIGICAYLLINQNRLLYVGIKLPPHAPGAAPLPALRAPNGRFLGWLVSPPGPAKATVVFFHGNDSQAWGVAHDYASPFLAQDDRVIFPEYPGYDMRRVEHPNHNFVIRDARQTLQAIRKTYPNQPIWVAGDSLGAGIAAQVAASVDPQRILLFVPWDRMSDVAAERYPYVPVHFLLWADGTDYNSCSALAGLQKRIFVVYAKQDTVIPAPQALALAKCLGVPDSHVLMLPKGQHAAWYKHMTAHDWAVLFAPNGDLPPHS